MNLREDEAAKYDPDWAPLTPTKRSKKRRPPQSRSLQAMQKAREQGEHLMLFPTVSMDDGDPEWEFIFKLVKKWKESTSKYGPTSPNALSLVENLAGTWLTPADWFILAGSCLTGGQFLLFKANYEDEVRLLLGGKVSLG